MPVVDIASSPLGEHTGAEVLGVDLTAPVERAMAARFGRALADHGVLVFRDQRLDAEQMFQSSRLFGDVYPQKHEHHIGFHPLGEHPHVHSISNKDRRSDGTAYVPGNGWHIDHTNALRPPKAIMLYAIQLPDKGGDTLFSNLALVYESLPADMRRLVDSLIALHPFKTPDNKRRRGQYFGARTEAAIETVTHPLVCTHPITGRRALYLNPARIRGIVGMPGVEAMNLLEDLRYRAIQPPFVFRHRWRPGDLVIWDNISLMHRATDDYDMNQTRRLYRIMIKGDAPG
jgi:taurine dioxygenase